MTMGSQWSYKPHDTYKTTKQLVHTLVTVVATGGSLLLDVGPMSTGELPAPALQRLSEIGEWMNQGNAEAIYDTVPQSPMAINVTMGTGADEQMQWRLTRAFPPTHIHAHANTRTSASASTSADTVYATLLLDTDTDTDTDSHASTHTNSGSGSGSAAAVLLPTRLLLPFVVDAPGGIDGTWPSAPLHSVEILGAGGGTGASTDASTGNGNGLAVNFSFHSDYGLSVQLPPSTQAPNAHAVVFRLRFAPGLALE